MRTYKSECTRYTCFFYHVTNYLQYTAYSPTSLSFPFSQRLSQNTKTTNLFCGFHVLYLQPTTPPYFNFSLPPEMQPHVVFLCWCPPLATSAWRCNVHAKVPWKWVPKHGKVGQRNTSECSRKPDMCGTEGLASAQRLHPHGMPVPYFRRTRLGLGPARMCKNRTKKGMRQEQEITWCYLTLWLRNPIYYKGYI